MNKAIITYQKNVENISNKIRIPKVVVEKFGRSFYMEIYNDYIKLVPISKGE